ncbi:MAG: hypothetical protein ACI9NG_001431 [Hyphomonas sp.]|jgi:hypothetical protein
MTITHHPRGDGTGLQHQSKHRISTGAVQWAGNGVRFKIAGKNNHMNHSPIHNEQ